MYRKLFNLISHYGIVVSELILLGVFLYWRYKLGISRYFDIDEFTHLHWGYSLFIGERPYTDFFYLFPPFFLYALYPLFAFLGRSIAVLIRARVFVYFTFLGSTLILICLGRKLKNLSFGLLAAIIFVFLPLPLDKMIEVRPDNLALLLALLGLYLFIKGAETEQKKYLFLSGFCYSLSLGIVPKTVFFLVPPVMVLGYKFYCSITSDKLRDSSIRQLTDFGMTLKFDIIPFLSGLLLPALLLIGLIIIYGNPAFSIYSMTKMASNVTATLGAKFYMRPDLFFYPNDTYYGLADFSLPYLTNLIIYIGASLLAVFRFISSLSHTDGKKCLREFMVGGTFFANLFAFVFVFPLKHAQYLIPLAPFIAFYGADAVKALLHMSFWGAPTYFGATPESGGDSGRTRSSLARMTISTFVLILFLIYLGVVGQQMYSRKISWTNKAVLEKVERLLKTIPAKEPVFDLTGETIFYPNGYYFCCLPYGQYEEALLFKLPDLSKTLLSRGTKYVYTGSLERLNVLPAQQAKYIRENFVNYWSDGSLLIKK